MRKITFGLFLVFFTFFMQAQIVVLQENFTTYLGTAITAPAGWYFSSQGNYTTVASSGTSGPNSYRFGVTNATVITPQFAAGADSLKFWTKLNGSGTPANDTMSVFYIYESLDSTNFTVIDSIRPIAQVGKSRAYKLLATTKWIKFIYKKIGGNLAFDDFKIIKNPPVTANFTATNVCLGTCMPFTNSSSSTAGPVIGWFWDFDNDGNVDDVTQNPCYQYLTSGTHTVTMVAVDVLSNFDTITKTVTVYGNPTAAINALDGLIGCVGDTLCFNNNSTGGTAPFTYAWDLGSGINYSTANICHTYTVFGLSSVEIVVVDGNGCKDSINLGIQIHPTPASSFTTTNVCATSTVCFNAPADPNICSLSWDFGDGSSPSTQTNPCHNYASTGTYTVCLTTIGCTGCTSTSCNTITVFPLPASNFTFTGVGLNYSFTDLSTPTGAIATWSWDFGNPASGVNNTSNLQNPTHLFTGPGFYSVLLIVVDTNGCQAGNQMLVSPSTVGIAGVNGSNLAIVNHQNFVSISSDVQIGDVEIYNSLGASIYTEKIVDTHKVVVTEQIPSGIYFIRMKYKNEYVMKKITITH